jgi:uncharacterized protein YneR
MKKYLLLLILLLPICIACDPHPDMIGVKTGIPATFLKVKPTYNVNDTISIHFEVPQEIEFQSGSKIVPSYSPRDGASLMFMTYKADSSHVSSIQIDTRNSISFWVNPGAVNPSGRGFSFARMSETKMEAVLHLLLREKGIYYIDFHDPGYLSSHDWKHQYMRIRPDFGTQPLNHELLLPHIRSDKREQFKYVLESSQQRGLPIYVFEVK